jgi:4-hydroxy-tetrahydrodipicolinate synthase
LADDGERLRPVTGIVPPVCTPFDADGDLDVTGLERLVAALLDAGVSGLFVLGSSGEAAYLADERRRRVVDVVVGTVAGAVPVLVGALDTVADRVVAQTRLLDREGVAGWVVTAPYYARTSDAETFRHFQLVAAGTGRPVFAYDIPGNVGRKLPFEVAAELLERGVIAGLKDSSGDHDGFARLVADLGPDRSAALLTGSDTGALAALDAGADGIVPGLANVFPDLFVALAAAVRDGVPSAAAGLQEAITVRAGLFSIGERHGLARHASELGALKLLLHERGLIATPLLAPPLSPYPASARAELLELMGAPS